MHVEQWENQTWSWPSNTWIVENNKLRVTWPSVPLWIAQIQGYLSKARDGAHMRFASLASILDTKYLPTDKQEKQLWMSVYPKLQNKLNVFCEA